MNIKNFRLHTTSCSLIGIALLSIAAITGFHHYNARTSVPSSMMKAEIGNPCQIAYAAHSGDSMEDRKIVRYQKLAQRKRTPDAYLERLGWAYIAKARTSFDPGYIKLAQQTAHCMARKHPTNIQAQLLLGHVLHQLHQFKEAEKLARQLVEVRGSWLDYGLLGDVQMEQGKLTAAVDAYQQMLDQRPGPQAYFRAAHIRWLKGDLQGAFDMMEMVVSALGGKDKETAAWTYVKLADYERQANNYIASDAFIQRALEFQPDYPPALLLRGEMLMSRKEYRKAVQVLAKAVSINPLPLYQWAYWEALHQAGDTEQANVINQELIEKGALLDRRSFSLYLTATGQNPLLALSLARQELESRQDVFTLDALAWAMRANGQFEQARNVSSQALAEGTIDGRIFYHAAVIADESGRPKQAYRYYQNAIELKHLLFPSERRELESKFAAAKLQNHDLALNL